MRNLPLWLLLSDFNDQLQALPYTWILLVCKTNKYWPHHLPSRTQTFFHTHRTIFGNIKQMFIEDSHVVVNVCKHL